MTCSLVLFIGWAYNSGNGGVVVNCIRKETVGNFSLDLVNEGGACFELSSEPLASDAMCEECFDIVLSCHTGDSAAGPAERKRQIEESSIIVVDKE